MRPETQYNIFERQLQSNDAVFENRGSFCLARSITMLVLATVCVALRFWCRKIRFAKYALDDWMLLAALVSISCLNANGHFFTSSC